MNRKILKGFQIPATDSAALNSLNPILYGICRSIRQHFEKQRLIEKYELESYLLQLNFLKYKSQTEVLYAKKCKKVLQEINKSYLAFSQHLSSGYKSISWTSSSEKVLQEARRIPSQKLNSSNVTNNSFSNNSIVFPLDMLTNTDFVTPSQKSSHSINQFNQSCYAPAGRNEINSGVSSDLFSSHGPASQLPHKLSYNDEIFLHNSNMSMSCLTSINPPISQQVTAEFFPNGPNVVQENSSQNYIFLEGQANSNKQITRYEGLQNNLPVNRQSLLKENNESDESIDYSPMVYKDLLTDSNIEIMDCVENTTSTNADAYSVKSKCMATDLFNRVCELGTIKADMKLAASESEGCLAEILQKLNRLSLTHQNGANGSKSGECNDCGLNANLHNDGDNCKDQINNCFENAKIVNEVYLYFKRFNQHL